MPVLGTMTKLQVIDINYLQFLLSSRINAASTSSDSTPDFMIINLFESR